MERALATVEVLELILAETDMQTLLVSARRVCWRWHRVIEASPRLQTQLFFRPAAQTKKPCKDRPRAADADALNPLLLRRFLEPPDHGGLGLVGSDNDGASWRRMLVAQPAATRLGVWTIEMGCFRDRGFRNVTETVEFDGDGGLLRMGRLAEYVVGLGQGCSWRLFVGGAAGRAEEGGSLFLRKAPAWEERGVLDLWERSDVVLKVTRWVGGM